jgi:hypothetical protein
MCLVETGKSLLKIPAKRLELGSVSAVDSEGRTIWIVDANRGDGKRFVVHADEKLTALWNSSQAQGATRFQPTGRVGPKAPPVKILLLRYQIAVCRLLEL